MSLAMAVRELRRNTVMIVLALAVPAVFFAAVFATTSERTVPITLAAVPHRITAVEERRQSLLFISIAATSLMAALFASNLVQRQVEAQRRLILCGYTAAELLAARFTSLLGIIAATSLYTWLVLAVFSEPRFPVGVLLGLALGACVYGCYGLLVGTTFRRELEAIFAIIALINIDAGWLQNPIYYQTAGSKWLIEGLPAHHASQTAYMAAFTSEDLRAHVAYAIGYGAVFFLSALAVYVRRMRLTR